MFNDCQRDSRKKTKGLKIMSHKNKKLRMFDTHPNKKHEFLKGICKYCKYTELEHIENQKTKEKFFKSFEEF